MTDRVSCPYCNTAVTLGTTPPTGKTTCPRCGESFAVGPANGHAAPADPGFPVASANGTYPPLPPAPPPPVAGLRPLGLIAAGLVVVVVGLAGFYLATRPPEPTPATPTARRTGGTAPPLAVPALGYLPADAGVVAAVQVPPVVAYADRGRTDPHEFLRAAGVPAAVLDALARGGVPLGQMDHVAVGLTVPDDTAVPRAVAAVVLTGPPADEPALLRAVRAERHTAAGGGTRYHAQVGGLPVELAKVEPATYLFATGTPDLDAALAAAGRAGGGHLPPGVREAVGELSPASVAWAAAGDADWAAKPAPRLLAGFTRDPDLPKRLAAVRAAALGVSFEPGPTLTVAARGSDPDSLRAMLDDRKEQLPGLRVETAGGWVRATAPFDAKAGLPGLLRRPRP